MKKIKFTCSNCQAKLRVPTHLAGVSAPCPKCGSMITAPTDISNAVEEEIPPRREAVTRPPENRERVSTVIPSAREAAAGIVSPVGVMAPPDTGQENRVPARHLSETVARKEEILSTDPAVIEKNTETTPEHFSETEVLPVVVEEFYLPTEPAAALKSITQPIQVNPRPGILPEARGDRDDEPDALPRLDVSLAGKDLSAAAAVLFPEGGSFQGKARVQLPQPGGEPHQFSPDDFIYPPDSGSGKSDDHFYTGESESGGPGSVPEEALYDPLSLSGDNLPAPLVGGDLSPIGAFVSDDSDEQWIADPAAIAETRSSFPEEGVEDPAIEPEQMDDWNEEEFEISHSAANAAPLPWITDREAGSRIPAEDLMIPVEDPVGDPVGAVREIHIPDSSRTFASVGPYDEVPVDPLKEGSFGKLLSRHSISGSAENGPEAERKAFDGTGRTFPGPADPVGPRGEGDVLNDLFGEKSGVDGGSKGLSKTAVVMLCGVAGAAIIATVVVVFLINLMGGLDPAKDLPESAEKGSQELPASPEGNGTLPSNVVEPSLDGVPSIIDPVAVSRDEGIINAGNPEVGSPGADAAVVTRGAGAPSPETAEETPALSFDERVQQVVNGINGSDGGDTGVGAPSLNPVDSAIASFTGASSPVTLAPADSLEQPAPLEAGNAEGAAAASAVPTAPVDPVAPSASIEGEGKSANYNPAESFPAPGPNDNPLRYTNDIIDAFLRAPDWQSRIKYTHGGESLRPAIEEYYRKWPDLKMEKFSVRLYQNEMTASLGGPFWVYLVSTSDLDQGFPMILRVEDGNLKVDWEIFTEFYDRRFVKFREGTMPRPSTFRLVIERVSGYFEADREAFTDLEDYYIYEVSPPYGDLDEFSDYAFVKKDTELAKKLDGVVGLNDEPLAVIISLDEKTFANGKKHFVISDYLTEGWFR